jgi:predicted DsbA family dithiol-disulfide isomerase
VISDAATGPPPPASEETGRRPLPITVFADFTCPYSYLAEATLWEIPATRAELRFRARELYPAPGTPPSSAVSPTEWVRIADLARDAGIELRPPEHLPSTRKAHEAVRFARDRGGEVSLRQAIYSLFWSDGADIARIDVLAGAAASVGLDAEELRIALDIDRYATEVDEDQLLGDRLRIPGTPAIFLGTGATARIVLGTRPAGELRRLVDGAIGPGPENE